MVLLLGELLLSDEEEYEAKDREDEDEKEEAMTGRPLSRAPPCWKREADRMSLILCVIAMVFWIPHFDFYFTLTNFTQ